MRKRDAKRNEGKQGMDEQLNRDTSRNNCDKRTALRSLLGVTMVASGSKYWIEPLVNSVVLPAHAQTTTPEAEPEQPPLGQPPVQGRGVPAPDNTPPRGENVVVDAQQQTLLQYSLLPHISDQESPSDKLTISIVSLPASGILSLIGAVEFSYQLSPQSFSKSDRFDYQVADPQGLKSPVYTVDLINFPVVPQ